MLAAAGVAFPRGAFVTDRAAALRAAAEIGFPVALKLQSATLAHKTDAGAIALAMVAILLVSHWVRRAKTGEVSP